MLFPSIVSWENTNVWGQQNPTSEKKKVQAQLQKPDQLLTQMESQLSVGVEFEEAGVEFEEASLIYF